MDPLEGASPDTRFKVVALLASAGGLDPLTSFFKEIPESTGLAYLVLQHHAQDRVLQLPVLLERCAAIPIRLAQGGDEVRPDQALVLSGGMSLAWDEGRLRIRYDGAVETMGMPGDRLFQSMAECLGERAVGVVLSGSGQDGTEGLRSLQSAGGLALIQDPATAIQDGMPRHAMAEGVVDAAIRVEDLFTRVFEAMDPRLAQAEGATDLQDLCDVLSRRTGNDFSLYKPGTLRRRIQRRMQATGTADLGSYLTVLKGSQEEAEALHQDLLVSVTDFFRDEKAFQSLMVALGDRLQTGETEPLRIWVPGCATGEEAYSLAILVRECLDSIPSQRRVQIFATDIDSSAILRAKAGRFSREALRNVAMERRHTFFREEGGAWTVTQAIRSMVTFSLQNLLRDPPFSSLDLISCRNVFIYIKTEFQAKLIPIFHFALKPGGLLFLGNSEGLAADPLLFEPLHQDGKIFLRRDVQRKVLEFPVGDRRMSLLSQPASRRPEPKPTPHHSALGLFEQMLFTYYLPASAIINERGDILFCAGQIGKYLAPGLGQLSGNLIANTSGPLHWEIKRLLALARTGPGRMLQAVVNHETGSGEERLRLTLRPMPGLDREARIHALIIQAESSAAEPANPEQPQDLEHSLLDQMNLELQSTRVELQVTVEELEESNEKLQAFNEELQSSNEELQASQEELRSLNEELNGSNSLLMEKIRELNGANGDLQNLMASTNIPTIFLAPDLSIRLFTPSVTQLFGLIQGDLGRPIRDLVPRFTGMDLPALATEVLASHQTKEAEVHSLEGDRWYVVHLNPYRSPDHANGGVVVAFLDMTEIRRAQMLALENEARYKNLFKNLVSGFAHCRMRFEGGWPVDYQYLNVNDAYLAQRGIGDPSGHWATELIPGIRHNDDEAFQLYGRVARSGQPERHEIFVATLGQWFDMTVYSPLQDEFVAVFDEITARKQAEAALMESEERYRSLFESSLAVLLVLDPADGAILAANPAAAAFYGWSRAVLETMRIQEINTLPPEAVRANMAQVLADGRHAFTFQHRLADGRLRDVEVFASPILVGGKPRLYVIIQDVTERKQAEASVLEGRVKLEAALASMADAVFISDCGGRFVHCNEAFATFHRFPDKSACARTFAEYPDLLEVFLPDGSLVPVDQWAVPRALRGETAVNQEYTLRRKDTGETWIGSYNFAPLWSNDDRIMGSVVTARDITAQKAAERALVESELRFRTVFDSAPDAILIRTSDGRFTDVNQVALDRFGYTREEFRQMTPEDLSPPRLAGQHQASAEKAILSGAPAEWVNVTKDGTEFPVEVTLKPFTLYGETFICASVHDLTERKRAEAEKADLHEQLTQTQKMDSLGRLAGGVAHDMNNVLAAIFAVTQALQARYGSESDLAETLAIIERAAVRGRDLVKGLVGFARKDQAATVAIDLNEMVRNEAALLEHTLLQKYQVLVDLEEHLPPIQGEAGALGSALMNLCVNAVDAMPEGGTLRIQTHSVEGGSVQIIVEDTGLGMSPEVVKRAVEPFYTTKPVGKGTGLGLAMVFSTARAHGGSLAILSEEGKGTRMLLTLPILGAPAGEKGTGTLAPQARSAFRILMVDDDELLRATVPMMLQMLGHEVLAVDGGRAALAYLAKEPTPDLVILDLNMPDMNGMETLRRIRARFPELPVLLASGFVEPGVENLAAADPHTLLIAKPFSVEELSEKFSTIT